jgi:hypothetical protein
MHYSRGTQRRYGAPSPNLGRKIGTVLAFAAGGLIACASGFALLNPELPSARAVSLAAKSSSSEIAAPVVITTTPVAPAVAKQVPTVETKNPLPETKQAVPDVKQAVPEAKQPAAEKKQPVAETKITTADPAKPCAAKAADGGKPGCDTVAAKTPDVVPAKPAAGQAKSDAAAAVKAPAPRLSVPAAIAFEPAPRFAPVKSQTKSTDDERPTKQAALPSSDTAATRGTHPSAEATRPAEATQPATAEVTPAPVQPHRATRSQSRRRSSYYEDRYYRRRDHQNFFFPFFR